MYTRKHYYKTITTTQELKFKGWFFTQKDVLNVFLKVSGIQNKSESKISITKAAKAQT